MGGVGRPSQALDDTGVDEAEAVEPLPQNPTNGGDGTASAEQVAADLRRTEFLRPECLLPVAAVAEQLGLSASTVHEATNAGKLRAVLFGSVRRVRPEDLDAYVRLRSASRPPADEAWCTVLPRDPPLPSLRAAPNRPGFIVKIDEDGTRIVGRFVNRKFKPVRRR